MHLKERVPLSHSTKADFITTELTNRNQQEKCCAFLNLTQRAHKSYSQNVLDYCHFSYSFIARIIMTYILLWLQTRSNGNS